MTPPAPMVAPPLTIATSIPENVDLNLNTVCQCSSEHSVSVFVLLIEGCLEEFKRYRMCW